VVWWLVMFEEHLGWRVNGLNRKVHQNHLRSWISDLYLLSSVELEMIQDVAVSEVSSSSRIEFLVDLDSLASVLFSALSDADVYLVVGQC